MNKPVMPETRFVEIVENSFGHQVAVGHTTEQVAAHHAAWEAYCAAVEAERDFCAAMARKLADDAAALEARLREVEADPEWTEKCPGLYFRTCATQQPEAQAVAEPAWITELRAEALQGAMKDVYWLSRDQVFALIGTHPTTPPVKPGREGVTDAMVERIGNAHGFRSYTCDASGRNVQHTAWRFTRDELKAALQAALATKPAKGGEGREAEPMRRVSCVVCGHWNDDDGKRCGTCGCRP